MMVGDDIVDKIKNVDANSARDVSVDQESYLIPLKMLKILVGDP